MRITFLSPAANLTGGQRVIATYADRLLARGHDVTVVARDRQLPTRRTKLKHLLRGRRLQGAPPESHFDRMKARYVALSHTGPITADDVPDADAVVATWWETAFEAAHLPPSKGRGFYFVQHHEVHSYLPTHLAAGSYYLPLRKIAVSSWLVDTMRDLYSDYDVDLVPNSVDHGLFSAPARTKRRVPTVGLMYNPAPFKGVDIALRAIAIARQIHPGLHVVAFGTHRPTENMPLPEDSEFHFNPPQTRLRELYAGCDVFIAASRSEGFGLPIVEAMACRTPVVATRTGCAEDMIEQGRTGYLADVDDAEALGAHLTELCSMDSDRWSAMSEAAYNETLSYTWDDAAKLFESALLREFELRSHDAVI